MKRIVGAMGAIAIFMAMCSCSHSQQSAELTSQQIDTVTAIHSSSPNAIHPVVIPVESPLGNQISLTEVLLDEFPEGIDDIAISFNSQDESVVIVDGDGLMTSIGHGQTSVSVTGGERPISVQVTVPEPFSMRIEADYCQLKIGEVTQIKCLITGNHGSTPLWTSSDETVVTVASDGTLTGISNGTAWVSATLEDFTDRIAVWVTDSIPYAPLTNVKKPRFTNEGGIYRNPSSPVKEEVSILLTGDLMALSSQQNAARQGDTYNYNSSFELVSPIFTQGDFVIGNLETCLSFSNPYTVQAKTIQGNPNCNAQATFLDALRYAGYDAVVTANNHCGDTGSVGTYETLQQLDSYRIAHTGTFSRAQQPRFLLVDVAGIRVALLSYTEIINTKSGSLAIPDEDQLLMFNRYSEEKLRDDIAAAKEAGAEFIVAYNHWGQENTHTVTDKQMVHAQQMADAGVDFIAGSHPHCLQPATMITASDERQVPCIFSMGNFVSGMGKDINNDTVILKLDLKRMDDAHIGIAHVGYVPCRVCAEYEGGHHVVVPISSELNNGRHGQFLESAERRIDSVMGNGIFEKLTTIE